MSGATMVSLALAIDADPKAGLIQTVPRLVGRETLLQRLQQFACKRTDRRLLQECLLAPRPGQLLGP